MIDAGLPLSMASDFNPGSSPSGNMQLVLSMASILYRLTPEEAINAVTLNSAYAMGVEENWVRSQSEKRQMFLLQKKFLQLSSCLMRTEATKWKL